MINTRPIRNGRTTIRKLLYFGFVIQLYTKRFASASSLENFTNLLEKSLLSLVVV